MRIYIGQKSVNNQKQAPELFVKKAFLEISQNSQENTCVKSLSSNKVAGLRRLWRRRFPVNFVKFSKNTFVTELLQATASE